MKVNKEELIVGAVYGLVSIPFIGIMFIPMSVGCAVLWALGGAENISKLWRRIGIPVAFAGTFILHGYGILGMFLAGAGAFGVLSIGYGIPSRNDEGSKLGKFVMAFTQSQTKATWIIRTFLFLLFMTCWFVGAQI